VVKILSRDNLKKKGWKGSYLSEKLQIPLCDAFQTQKHLFFVCALASYLWNVVGVSMILKNRSFSFLTLYQ
jgi:hypothetical protein